MALLVATRLQWLLLLIVGCIFPIFTLAASPSIPDLTAATQNTDRYIVVFKPNLPSRALASHMQAAQRFLITPPSTTTSTNTTASATTRASTLNYTSIGQFHWYAGEFYSDKFEQLLGTTRNASDDVIHYWVKDVPMSLQEFVQTNPPSWGLDRIDQRQGTNGQYRFPTKQGEGVTVYVLDTGVFAHKDLEGRLSIGPSVLDTSEDGSNDVYGHGTFVAGVCCGTEYGVAKQAQVVSVKTLDDEGNGNLSDLLKGLQWVTTQHKPGAKSVAANDAIEQATVLGIHVVIAAGNYGEDACKYSPGSAPTAVTVGAIDSDDAVAKYSNFGACVDLFAPGTDIVSIGTSNDATQTLTGTSMAAPHVAGAMALYLSEADYTPSTLATHLRHVSSLVSNHLTLGTGNKSVLDNGVGDGWKVPDYYDETATPMNILFTHPIDGQQFYIFGQVLNSGARVYPSFFFGVIILMMMSLFV
ncbi:peptidase S8/S53 domain-containing protein [Syncephalastrum racemosum]|uniref:Peptidase S8/S53 domain-containing protein n=1 Tax=Syncephalastrum racemosum TaxID=13706 RepID=A0A1X2HJX2_SYNRA|nr:peptidase S8/S53 domain-containing protein [Syncephalastrum racemosum]